MGLFVMSWVWEYLNLSSESFSVFSQLRRGVFCLQIDSVGNPSRFQEQFKIAISSGLYNSNRYNNNNKVIKSLKIFRCRFSGMFSRSVCICVCVCVWRRGESERGVTSIIASCVSVQSSISRLRTILKIQKKSVNSFFSNQNGSIVRIYVYFSSLPEMGSKTAMFTGAVHANVYPISH
jgi:hypothetical protein